MFNFHDGGLIGKRLRNMRYITNKERKRQEIGNNGVDENEELQLRRQSSLNRSDLVENSVASEGQSGDLNGDPSQEEMENALEFLRTTNLDKLDDESMKEIRHKLQLSVKYRKEMMAKTETHVAEDFSFFFSHPDLLNSPCHCHSINFKSFAMNVVDSHVFN